MKWYEMLQRLFFLYDNKEGITYNLGCSGEVAGRDKIVEDNFKYYYSSTKPGEEKWHDVIGNSIPGWKETDTADQAWKKFLKVNKGKMCFDCSGLVCWICGYEGRHVWSSWTLGSMKPETTVSGGVAGSCLFKPGHVGIDFGFGQAMDIPTYGQSLRIRSNKDGGWTKSVQINGIDYTGAYAY